MARSLALLLFLLGTVACAPPVVSMQEGTREYVATDYPNVLARWTRSEDIVLFDELERALTVTATFESWDFRWAYVIRFAKDYRLTVPQRQQRLKEKLAEIKKNHEFFVALYGSNQKHNDLTRKDSAWIVRLIDSTGNETAPIQIERIKKPNTLQRRYYPYNTVWRRSFRVRFPRANLKKQPTISPDATWVGLRFAGAMGNTDLIWEIGPTPAAGVKSDLEASDEQATQ